MTPILPTWLETRRDRVVHVGRDDAGLHAEIGAPTKRHVLAYRADHLFQVVGNADLAAAKFGLGKGVEVPLGSQRVVCNDAYHLLELVVARDEVGL